jgi:hypothetical protein
VRGKSIHSIYNMTNFQIAVSQRLGKVAPSRLRLVMNFGRERIFSNPCSTSWRR